MPSTFHPNNNAPYSQSGWPVYSSHSPTSMCCRCQGPLSSLAYIRFRSNKTSFPFPPSRQRKSTKSARPSRRDTFCAPASFPRLPIGTHAPIRATPLCLCRSMIEDITDALVTLLTKVYALVLHSPEPEGGSNSTSIIKLPSYVNDPLV